MKLSSPSQGLPSSSGSGLTGWAVILSGSTSSVGTTETTLASTAAVGTIHVAFVASAAGVANLKVIEGNTGAAAPSGTIVYSLKNNGGTLTLTGRCNTGTENLVWVIYGITP